MLTALNHFGRACRSLYKQSGAGVPVLSAPDGTTVNSNLDKAVLLNTHFAKCFNTAFPPLVPPSVNTTDPPDDNLGTTFSRVFQQSVL